MSTTTYTPREEPAPWKHWSSGETEEEAIRQMRTACMLPVAQGGALMPDAHTGYGLPIGGVLAVRNAVIPYAVGVDIACRMRISVLDIPPKELEKKRKRFAAALEKQTRFGVGACFAPDELREHPVMDEDWGITAVTKELRPKAHAQLGTSGHGNHFAEFGTLTVPQDLKEPGLSLPAGVYVALLTHSGSRGTGESVAQHYSQLARSMHPELPDALAHLAWLDMDTAAGQEYWAAMHLMGRYAAANHELVHQHVIRALRCDVVAMVENHHNFAWKETHRGEELIVHRKGATPAALGSLGVVPGSMGTPGFVVRGRGNADAYCSCSHGAGRRISRRAAYKLLDRADMEKFLAKHNVHLISGCLDESPRVYKDIEKVLAAQADLVDVLARFDPRIVKMAPEKK